MSYDLTPDDIKKIIIEGNSEKLIEKASQLGGYYAPKDKKDKSAVTTSQIRNILDKIQRMREFNRHEVNLLRPLLAYAAGRHDKTKLPELQRNCDNAIKEIKTEEHFKNFRNFFEAIVAYHRCAGGKE